MSYGRGGPLTVTDANLMLGRLLPEHFPAVFGPGGNQPLDRRPVEVAFAELALQIEASGGGEMSAETVAEGFIRVANDNMANAIKTVSIHRGYNPEDFSLCCFGGAGGQHACQVAEALGLGRVILHPLAGVLSAWGMGMAPLRAYRQATADLLLNQESEAPLRAQLATLADSCLHDLREQGAETDRATVDLILNIRIPGSDTSLPVPWQGSIAAARQAFHDLHARQFGFSAAASELWVETLRVDATVADGDDWPRTTELPSTQKTTPTKARVFCAGIWRDAPVCFRSALPQEEWLDGPMIVVDPGSTTVVEPGWAVLLDAEGRLQLHRQFSAGRDDSQSDSADPVLLEIFNSHFMNVAEQMGAVLENTAHSVNIKERKDFSCALFDHAGRLIANAPHIPVHLGSMGESVRSVLETGGLQPGDSWMLNDPYRGGTHLPDITVVTPVFDATGDCIQFVVACRAHHADIGGISPGSMPAFSRTIGEEGICFEPFRLVSGGCFQEADLRQRLGGGDWPARNPDQNIADLRAQLAANEKGVQQIAAMVRSFGLQRVQAYMRHVRNNAAESVRRALTELREGECQLELDGGERISVRLQIDQQKRTASLDFSASSPQSAGNLNAPPGITRAVVLYVFRCLLPGRIPLNEGCLEPLEIQIPEDSILNPRPPAAVAAGNVETSQCIADALLGALGVLAASQGTMNNLSFGDGRYQYYETICGGAGAGPDFAGTDAVHTHMTNSRITDAEILESRYPVLLREFSIRPESGGRGRHDGGNGVVRAIEFRASMHAEIVSSRRLKGPPGIAGGNSGRPGVNLLVHASGEVETLPGIARTEVEPGDMLIIATPGGGGYGPIPQ